MSGHFASTAADVFGANDIKVLLSTEITPTPTLSTAVVNRKADLGIMITASHNPYYYNGYKIKGPFGGSATMDIIGDVEIEVEMIRWGDSRQAHYSVNEKERFYLNHCLNTGQL